MKKLLLLLFIIPTILFAQNQVIIYSEDFNGFFPSNLVTEYQDNTLANNFSSLDTSLTEWRIDNYLNFLTIGDFDGNATPFIVSGSWPMLYNESVNINNTFYLPKINTLDFDSVKLSFESHVYTYNNSGTSSVNNISLSNDNLTWYEIWFDNYNTIASNNLEYYEIDISNYADSSLSIKFHHQNWYFWALDNIQVIGYSSNMPTLPCDTFYITQTDTISEVQLDTVYLPQFFYDTIYFPQYIYDTIYETQFDTIILYDTIYVDTTHVGMLEINNQNGRKLLRVTDMLGRDVDKETPNQVLIFIYNDGYIEKKYLLK